MSSNTTTSSSGGGQERNEAAKAGEPKATGVSLSGGSGGVGMSLLSGSGGVCAGKTGAIYDIASDARLDALSAADASAKQASAAQRHKVDIIDDDDD